MLIAIAYTFSTLMARKDGANDMRIIFEYILRSSSLEMDTLRARLPLSVLTIALVQPDDTHPLLVGGREDSDGLSK